MNFNKIPTTKIRRVVLAVDPFETDVTLDLPIVRELDEWASDNSSGMVVMASQSGPVGSFILGSHARGVFRVSEFPVWVYGPQVLEAEKRLNKKDDVDKVGPN